MRYIYLIMLLPCILLLTGCESQEEIDQLVSDYIDTKYGVGSIEFVYREGKNEGNMGDRTYTVKSKEDPSFTFNVLLDGLLKSEVVGDNYHKQAEAFQKGEEFKRTYENELKQLKYSVIDFSRAQNRTSLKELEVRLKSEKSISLNNEQSLKELYQVFELILDYNDNLEGNFLIYNLLVEYPYKDSQELLHFYYNVTEITSYEKLKSVVVDDIHFVNLSLLERYQSSFLELEKKIKNIGFAYREGFNEESVFCYGKDLSGGECQGFTLYLSGRDKSEDRLEALKTILKESELPIGEVVIANKGGAIVLKGFN